MGAKLDQDIMFDFTCRLCDTFQTVDGYPSDWSRWRCCYCGVQGRFETSLDGDVRFVPVGVVYVPWKES